MALGQDFVQAAAFSPGSYPVTASGYDPTGIANVIHDIQPGEPFSSFAAPPTQTPYDPSNIFNPSSGNFLGSGSNSILGGFSSLFGGSGSTFGGKPASDGTSASNSMWSDLFLRGTVIILGFIFVGTGLSMFRDAK